MDTLDIDIQIIITTYILIEETETEPREAERGNPNVQAGKDTIRDSHHLEAQEREEAAHDRARLGPKEAEGTACDRPDLEGAVRTFVIKSP